MPSGPRRLPPLVSRKNFVDPDSGAESTDFDVYRHAGEYRGEPEVTDGVSMMVSHHPARTSFEYGDDAPGGETMGGSSYVDTGKAARSEFRRANEAPPKPGGTQGRLFGMGHQPGQTEVSDLYTTQSSRALGLPMVGLAKIEAQQRGNELVASDDLSQHSIPFVEKLSNLNDRQFELGNKNSITFNQEPERTWPREVAQSDIELDGGTVLSQGHWDHARQQGRSLLGRPERPKPTPVALQGRMFHSVGES